MKLFNENMNENLDKLLSSKKMVLLIPGIIIAIIAMILLIITVVGIPPENKNGEQAILDAKETIMSELVQAREYLSQLEDVIVDNWKVLTQDHFTVEYDETRIASHYEVLKEKLEQMNEETYRYIEENESLDEETRRILLTIAGTLLSTRDDLERSYDEYLKAFEIMNKSNQDSEAVLKNLLAVLIRDTEKTSDYLRESMNEITDFLIQVQNSQTTNQNEHTEIINQSFTDLTSIFNENMDKTDQSFTDLTNVLNENMDKTDQSFTDLTNVLNENMDKTDQSFTDLTNVLNENMDKTDQSFTDLTNILNENMDKTDQSFTDLTNVLNENMDKTDQSFTDLTNILNENMDKTDQSFAAFTNIIEKDIEKVQQMLESLTNIVNKDINNLQQSLEAESIKLQRMLAKKIAGLTSDLAALKIKSDQAKDEISGILKIMDVAYETRNEEISKSLYGINNIMLDMSAGYVRVHEDVKKIYLEFGETASTQQEELLDALKKIADHMEADNSKNLLVLLDSVSILNQEIEILRNTNHESFSEIDNSISKRIDDLNDDISTKLSVNEDIIDRISKMEGEIDKKFSSLFQSFADGKGLLAAALANKGETVAIDANFASFAGAILNLSPDSTIIDLDGRLREAEAVLSALSKAQADHTEDDTTGIHGSAVTATANRLIHRDADGRAQIANPHSPADITNKDYVDNEMIKMKSDLETKIELIVQSVVNGKELLVSALRKKDQIIDDDPSFVDLYNAIMKIETGILTGDIVHTYHFHTAINDGNTASEDSHSLNAAVNSIKGGCFQDAITHIHQGNTINGGECYGSIVHSHSAGCYVAYVYGGTQFTCMICGQVYRDWAVPAGACHFGYPFDNNGGYCANCGRFGADHAFGGSRCNTLTCSIHPFALNCEKTIDGYATTCGYVYNQMTGAVIIY